MNVNNCSIELFYHNNHNEMNKYYINTNKIQYLWYNSYNKLIQKNMKISDLISEDLINLDIQSREKWKAIEELSILLLNKAAISSIPEYLDDVRKRESLVTTGIGEGIAIPHAISDSVLIPSIAIGRSRIGVDYEAIDNQPVKLFFLFAIPSNGAEKQYLRNLADLARLLVHKEIIDRLLNANGFREITETFQMKIN